MCDGVWLRGCSVQEHPVLGTGADKEITAGLLETSALRCHLCRVQGHFVGVLRAGAGLHITTFLVCMWPRCPGSGCGPGHCCHCCAGSMGSALPRATGIIPKRELEPHLLSPF